MNQPQRPGKSGGPHLMPCVASHNVWGGIETWLFDLLHHLRERDWQITIGLTRGTTHNDPEAFRRAHPGFDYVEFDGRTGTPFGRCRAVASTIQCVNPDIVLPLNVADAFGAVSWLKRAGHGVRAVATLHYFKPELFSDMRTLAPALDMCVAVNPLQSAYLQKVFSPERLKCVPHGVRRISSHREALPQSTLRLAYVGRLTQRQKRIHDAVALVRELEARGVDFQLSFVGSGPAQDELKTALQLQVDKGNVLFLGFQQSEHIQSEVFPLQDVLLLFSDEEAGPLVMLEAMTQGVVPVSSEFVGVHAQGWLQPGKTGLIFPVGDVATAAVRIEKLANDRDLLARLSSGARDIGRSCTLAQSLRRWEDTLRSVLDLPLQVDPTWTTGAPGSETVAGRLEAFGMSPQVANRLRHWLRRWPKCESGYAEWPGTMSALGEPDRVAVWEELRRLDRMAFEDMRRDLNHEDVA